MGDLQLNVLGPVVSIIGALFSATVGALVTYFLVAKRKRVEFWVAASESIAPPSGRGQDIVFMAGDREIHKLNRSGVQVKNVGNSSIQKFEFYLELSGHHAVCLVDVAANNAKLRDAVKLECVVGTCPVIVAVSLDFFNPGESFQVLAYFDGLTEDWMLNFRMEEVRFKLQEGGGI